MFFRLYRVIGVAGLSRSGLDNRPASSMRALSIICLLTLLAGGAGASAASLPSPQQVNIPVKGGVLHAQLYRPEGSGPFPAVIALHACGGLPGRTDPVKLRYRDWAERLLKSGNAVLLPDSYGSRQLGPQCNVKEPRLHARRERVVDIMASRQWLLQQSWVAHDRISLIGWANGASALLWAVRPQAPRRKGEPDFHSAVAFYPDCRLSAGLGWSARVPTLLLIGGSDNVSSPSACRQMVDGAHGRSALVRIVVYPGADHDFDRANLPQNASAGTTQGETSDPRQRGTDTEARTEAHKLVAQWLTR